MISATISNLEDAYWTPEVGRDINDPEADNFRIVQTGTALSLVMCSKVPYSGWLAKQVSPLVFEASTISFHYHMMIDDATVECAQVAETDAKITDSQGWTYDLSAQWEMQKAAPNWTFQVDNFDWKWTDTSLVVTPPDPYDEVEFTIKYALDYSKKMSAITEVVISGTSYPLEPLWISARQVGWDKSQIVTQLQQVNNSEPGGYTLRFTDIKYKLE